MPPRCLVLVSSTSYRTDAFLAAGRRLGVDIVIGSNRCSELAAVYTDEAYAAVLEADGSLAIDFRDLTEAVAGIVRAAATWRFDAVVATDDHTAVIAAMAARSLGLPGNAPDATEAARNKSHMRKRLLAAGVACPRCLVFPVATDAGKISDAVNASFGFPAVIKGLMLSASRGVMRVNDESDLSAALPRLHAILRTRPEYVDGDSSASAVIIEEFIPGREVALEGILSRTAAGSSELRTLALFDKPDPLDGPFFEETIYVTPSRLPAVLQRRIGLTTAAAARALGLVEGPIHAELRLDERHDLAAPLPVIIEVAARSIGGLCARTLRFALGTESDHALEELVLRQALRLGADPLRDLEAVGGAAGVMMLPIARGGVLQSVQGVEAARAVPLVEDVVITIRPGERMVPLPEGSSYPGFVFARGAEPAAVEAALRKAHAELLFVVAPTL